MPVKVIKETIPPAAFMEYRGVSIYHCYEGGEASTPLRYVFTTDIEENPGFAFDLRDLLKQFARMGVSPDRYSPDQNAREIIQHAVNAGILRYPQGTSPSPTTTLICPKCGSADVSYSEWLLVRRQVLGMDTDGTLRVSREMKAAGKTRDQGFSCRECDHEFVQEVAGVRWDDDAAARQGQQTAKTS